MELAVFWTDFAKDKLNDIFEYYKQEASISVARKLVDGLVDHTLTLATQPHIGQREEILFHRSQEFRYLVYKSYKIIYWVNTEKYRIEVVHVFDARQNPIKLLKTP
jgi:plasmid stabilization system protein ParE